MIRSPITAAPPPPPYRLSTILLMVCLVALVVASFATLPWTLGAFFSADALRTTSEFLHGFAPPDLSAAFLQKVGIGTLETLAMSALGTLLAAVIGICLSLPASGRFGRPASIVVGLLQNVLRAVPELVWASILLIAAGLGPFAGTLALAIHTTGVLGRLFAEALENGSPAPEAALRNNGVNAIAAFLYATLPQAMPQIFSYTLYRWENNIRAVAILGVVGAGGLGQQLKYHLSLFQMQQAATVICAMLLLVALVDMVSLHMRRVLTN